MPDHKATNTANQAITKLNKIDFKNHIKLYFYVSKFKSKWAKSLQLLIKRRSWKNNNIRKPRFLRCFRELLIDADPQANSSGLGIDVDNIEMEHTKFWSTATP
jgi:hypothetical protein